MREGYLQGDAVAAGGHREAQKAAIRQAGQHDGDGVVDQQQEVATKLPDKKASGVRCAAPLAKKRVIAGPSSRPPHCPSVWPMKRTKSALMSAHQLARIGPSRQKRADIFSRLVETTRIAAQTGGRA